ncbi:MAG: hypothetical protein K6B28_04085 [Lachnospiraceae bacterium]|nr:hypothetical protein [Lachnospiraceae bacterium]
MMVDKKEEETVSEETESTEELSTSVTPASRVGSSTPDTSFDKTSSTDDILSMSETTNETKSIDSDTMILSKVKSEDVYTVADLDNELNEILHNDICKEKLTEKQIKWIKDGKNVLVSSFNSLKDLERFSANFNKTLKTSSYNKNNKSNLRPFRKEDIDVIRIMYVMDQPEDILDKYNIFFNDPPSFVAMYYKLDAFIRYVKKNFK